MERAAKHFAAPAQTGPAAPIEPPLEPLGAAPAAAETTASELRGEYALRYCPVCSQRLESRRCKLICNRCGYYMSCADYI